MTEVLTPPQPQVEPARFQEPRVGALKRIGRHLMSLVRRQEAPPAINHDAMAEAARAEGGPTHEQKLEDHGCFLRALQSAAGFALRGDRISANGTEWTDGFQIIATLEEQRDRLKQVEEGAKLISELNQDMKDLIEKYKNNSKPTSLSRALNQLDISEPITVNSEAEIRKFMDQGNQVMVFTPDADPKLSHIMHIGTRGRDLISLSDRQEIIGKKKKRYVGAQLNRPPYTIFTVKKSADAQIIPFPKKQQITTSQVQSNAA